MVRADSNSESCVGRLSSLGEKETVDGLEGDGVTHMQSFIVRFEMMIMCYWTGGTHVTPATGEAVPTSCCALPTSENDAKFEQVLVYAIMKGSRFFCCKDTQGVCYVVPSTAMIQKSNIKKRRTVQNLLPLYDYNASLSPSLSTSEQISSWPF